MKTVLLYSGLIILLIVSASSKPPKTKHWMENQDVPGIQFIDPEFGIDRTEVTNFHWCEFLYWTGRMYGLESEEYKSIVPDSILWSKIDTTYEDLDMQYYLRNPDYRNFPVVGITYEQVVKYCNWRSDRVFEYMLIRSKLRTWEQGLTADTSNFVTVERYLNGQITGLTNHPKIDRLPHYRLPDEAEWEKALKYNEARLQELTTHQRKDIENAKGTSAYKGATIPAAVISGKSKAARFWIFYLDRNVSELLNDGKSAIGKNWGGKIETEDVFPNETASVFVGFRCAFEWKEPKKAAQ